MAPNPAAVNGLLRQTIHYHLDNAAYENALFFSERYAAQDPKSNEAPYLLALSHLRLRDYRSAYDTSKPAGYRGIHLGCSWVFAQACLALERYKEGITALEKSKGLWSQKVNIGKHSPTTMSAQPDASVLLCLLGKLYREYNDTKKAVNAFEEALKINPFMWDAFTILCDMGVSVLVPNTFKTREHVLHSFEPEALPMDPKENGALIHHDVPPKKPSRQAGADLGGDPFSGTSVTSTTPDIDMTEPQTHSDFMSKIQAAKARIANSNNSSVVGSETPPSLSADAVPTRSSHEPPQAPPRRMRTAPGVDSSLEAPPRMNYQLGSRKTREKEKEEQIRTAADGLYQESEPAAVAEKPRSAIPGVERKRTVSGHPVPRSNNVEDPGQRRSARLNHVKPSSRANSGAATIGVSAGRELKKARPQISRIVRPGSSGATVGRAVSGNRKPIEHRSDDVHTDASKAGEVVPQAQAAPPRPTASDSARLEEAVKWTLNLMKQLGNGYYHLTRYQRDEALHALGAVPAVHQSTPWVLSLMGRAHFEQAAYAEAEKFFRKIRVQAPARLKDMEVYSTILWHLKRETDLSFLAHELIEADWSSHHAWCVLGNAWSLARDHEQALKCFKRATQLNPKFAYGFTLQGHEHYDNEEYDKALTAYRQAVAADQRHYNAYYGIGRVQMRLGAYDKAYSYFHAASLLNPYNAVLICCVGKALEKQRQIRPALDAYRRAVEISPKAPEMRYQKARGHLAIGEIEQALEELKVLKNLAPDEGTVHFLLAQLYKTVNNKQLAVKHYTNAQALDPKVCLSYFHQPALMLTMIRPLPRSKMRWRALSKTH